MLYRPVKGTTPNVSLKDAVRNGIAPDGALYLPEYLPRIPNAFFNNISGMTLPEIGYVVANMLFGSDIPAEKLKQLIDSTITFDIPFIETSPNRFTLDLTKGPTRNYNDLGARFMARLIETERMGHPANIVVATSENVGNAVADAFHNIKGVHTYVLFPSGSLSPTRRHELINYGNSVTPVEVVAPFSECQDLVRDIILDKEIQENIPTLSANSINIAILFPRVIFFFYAYARLAALNRKLDNVVIATPTENLGNLTAAVIARKMGLPVSRFIAILQNDLDASDIVNESRLVALMNGEEKIEIFSPETHPLRPEEIGITLITDAPESNIQQPKHGHQRRPIKIAPSVGAMRRIMLSQLQTSNTTLL